MHILGHAGYASSLSKARRWLFVLIYDTIVECNLLQPPLWITPPTTPLDTHEHTKTRLDIHHIGVSRLCTWGHY